MELNKYDKNKAGIYCITNIKNGKIYIGKSKNIYNRIREHIECLRKQSKNENRHLRNAGKKYGEDNFIYNVLEYIEFNEYQLTIRELYGITIKNSTDRKIGYNLRIDSSTQTITHEETRKLKSEQTRGKKNPNYGNYGTDEQKRKMSKLKKEQYKKREINYNSESVYKAIKSRNENGVKHPEQKDAMKQKVRERISKYKIYQYTKNNELVKIGDYVNDIIVENPTYKKHNIYAVCSGEKPSIYGYKGKKVVDEIVQTSLKDDE